jgi:hypothetical protein
MKKFIIFTITFCTVAIFVLVLNNSITEKENVIFPPDENHCQAFIRARSMYRS